MYMHQECISLVHELYIHINLTVHFKLLPSFTYKKDYQCMHYWNASCLENKFYMLVFSLIVCRLICDPKMRLGRNGIEDFKRHPFFHDMDWENIRNTKPPFIPEYSSPTDTRNFEPIEEEEAVPRRYHVRSSLRLYSICRSPICSPVPMCVLSFLPTCGDPSHMKGSFPRVGMWGSFPYVGKGRSM